MALPFSVGDLLGCIAFCRQIVNNCAAAEGVSKSHQEFKNTANHLQAGLEQIVQVISERNALAAGANPSEPFEHPNDRETAAALSEIISDFTKTLKAINQLLEQHPIDGDTGFVKKLVYWTQAEDDVVELVNRCKHHITTINFLFEPLKVKILTDIQESLRRLDAKMTDVMLGVSHLGGGIEELRQMLIRFGCEKPESGWEPRLAEIAAPEIETVDGLDQKFRNRLIYDCGLDLEEVSLPELTRSVVWWLEKGRIDETDPQGSGTLDPLRYLNLRKASWIVRGFEGHRVLQKSRDPKSLWHSYCQRLREEVDEVFKSLRVGALKIPSVESVCSLDPCAFTILVGFDDLETNDLAFEKPGEELVLDIFLPGTSQARPIRMLVFRQGTGLLRCMEVVRTNVKGVVQENTKEYVIRRSEWALRPFYAFDPEIQVWNLALYNSVETKVFTFGNPRDLFSFQHAFTGAQVIYTALGYAPQPSIEPPNFRRIEYQESGFGRSTRKFASGLLQLWLEKPRSRLNHNSGTPSTEPSLSPTTTRSMTWSVAPTIAASTMTATIHQENSTTTVVKMKPVEDSRLFVYMMNEKGTRTVLTFKMGDHITCYNTSCCGSYLTSNGLPKKRVPAQESEICCLRLVIETAAHGGKFLARVLEAPKNNDHDNLPGIRLDEKRLPEGSKDLKLSWFAITFESTRDKLDFMTEYHMLERIRKTKVGLGRGLVSGVRRGEKNGESPRTENEFLPNSPTKRSSTFSSFAFPEAMRRPSYP